MATDNRMPDDLQEAVAATLRRLRGEVRSQASAVAPAVLHSEPLFSSPRSEPTLPPVSALENLAAPDLLAGAGPEIPPTPAAREAMREGMVAYQEERARGRGRWLPYALSLTAIVVFAGVVWWAYQAIVGAPPAGEVPVIAAEQTPAKVPPTDQGVAEGTSQEKTVYEQISGASGQPKTEVLLPQPETPQAPPVPAPAPTPSEASTANSPTEVLAVLPPAGPAATTPGPSATPEPAPPIATTPANAAPQAMGVTEPGATGPAGAGSTSSEPATSAPPPATTPDSGAPAAGPASQPDIDLTGVPTLAPRLAQPAQAETVAALTTADNSGTAAPATQTAAVSDNFRIQLAALKSQAEAQKSWDRILAKHTDVLGSLTLHIVRADLGAQGIYYRVQAGPFADKVSAKTVCDQLKSAGQQCLVKP